MVCLAVDSASQNDRRLEMLFSRLFNNLETLIRVYYTYLGLNKPKITLISGKLTK